jgi:membrane protease subunit HflC
MYYEKRVLNIDPPVERVILAGQRPLLVDSFARYRIIDPLRFFQTVREESRVRERLGTIINASVRAVLGGVTLQTVLSEERADIMTAIKAEVTDEANRFGIEVVDVRMRRADLPDKTAESVYARMRSEREREARGWRCGIDQDLRQCVRQGPAILCILPLHGGLSKRLGG